MKPNVNVREDVNEVKGTARDAATSKEMSWLARLGYAVKDVVYLIIGILAVQLALGTGGKATDQAGALHTISQQPFGKFLLIVVAIGVYATHHITLLLRLNLPRKPSFSQNVNPPNCPALLGGCT